MEKRETVSGQAESKSQKTLRKEERVGSQKPEILEGTPEKAEAKKEQVILEQALLNAREKKRKAHKEEMEERQIEYESKKEVEKKDIARIIDAQKRLKKRIENKQATSSQNI